MKVFVTGGGGFLGFAIVKQLLQEGFEVASFSRKQYQHLKDIDVEHHQGNLTDLPALINAMQGCQAVFHTASKVGYGGSYSSFYKVNVQGTKHIIQACQELDISYLLYTSSPSVVYDGGSEGLDERQPYAEKFDSHYQKTKALAEQAMLDANDPSLVTCSLRPHLIWGPRDSHFLPVFYAKQRAGRLFKIGKGPYLVDTIFVENAARAHLRAFMAMRQNPEIVGGKAYFLSQDDPINLHEFIDRMLDTGGLPPVEKVLNPKMVKSTVWLIEQVYKLLNLKSAAPISLFVVKHLSSHHWYDISAAKNDFGYQPTISIDEGMTILKKWVKENPSFFEKEAF
jgi:nucleoside-diphosphate-sugar epimerase